MSTNPVLNAEWKTIGAVFTVEFLAVMVTLSIVGLAYALKNWKKLSFGKRIGFFFTVPVVTYAAMWIGAVIFFTIHNTVKVMVLGMDVFFVLGAMMPLLGTCLVFQLFIETKPELVVLITKSKYRIIRAFQFLIYNDEDHINPQQ